MYAVCIDDKITYFENIEDGARVLMNHCYGDLYESKPHFLQKDIDFCKYWVEKYGSNYLDYNYIKRID